MSSLHSSIAERLAAAKAAREHTAVSTAVTTQPSAAPIVACIATQEAACAACAVSTVACSATQLEHTAVSIATQQPATPLTLTLVQRLAAARKAKLQLAAMQPAQLVSASHAAPIVETLSVETQPVAGSTELDPAPAHTETQQPVETIPAPAPAPSTEHLSLKERLAAIRAKQALGGTGSTEPKQLPQVTESLASQLNRNRVEPATNSAMQSAASLASGVEYNEQQLAAIAYASEGKSFCLIGAAGTGKTTAVREIVRQVLLATPHDNSTADEPIALVSFTNRAVRNIRKAVGGLSETHLRDRGLSSCKTIHKILGFAPMQYEIEVPTERGGFTVRNTMRFEPTYRIGRELSHLKLIIIDEASMLGLALFKQLLEAAPQAVFIFIGDLNQLKPVMDDSILGFKLGELPVVELTHVYRQALESPIVGFQHNFTLAGKLLGDNSLAKISEQSNGQLTFHPIRIRREADVQAKVFANAMLAHMDAGNYDPCNDIILLPNYKNFGSFWVGLWIAQELGRRRNALVHEIQCTKHILTESSKRYFALGDFVIHNKEEFFIADIRPNAAYTGRELQPPSETMSRIGTISNAAAKQRVQDFESVLWDVGNDTEQREVCSHFITLIPANGCSSLEDAQSKLDKENAAVTLNARKEVADLEFGYAITIHKSQGSEWRKVFLAVSTHARNMLTRELLYTAMTRASKELYVYYSPDSSIGANDNTVARCIKNQEIKGRTWQDKVATFHGKRDEYVTFMQTPTEYGVRNN